jgi:predicted permease
VAIGIASRMLITPAVLLPLLYFYSLNKTSVADDPVFVVAACLILGSPPALTLAQITESASGDTFERLISKTMLVSASFSHTALSDQMCRSATAC